ncbi:hypothetical protein [Methyloceanibacter sp.]|uniref:hypothetical protein n=1 Tax=Methyloceanibacter sp. TaxID=1965321 RepID=UPI002CF16BF0|nr:hypothetical protein [Methyloceanibacter sp.]HML90824.1 hypothetical protein [Methyloceanibacter sp.]
MDKLAFTQNVLHTCIATALFLTPYAVAVAHTSDQIACDKTALDAMTTDIQSMPDGDAKEVAISEIEIAKSLMRKKDLEGCDAHMQSAIMAMSE